ncbi:conserved hypothetical protein [Methylobacterium sp. 4-46]|uniref:DUF6505 family protein n=1 Tax=unclassified Methylobacterium TaxID=2615210 RepID=UPI000165C7A4|nr:MULTISPECIES: DUF6505 family protein [Methylobacterium]ACA17491.1 conserved hypothetical protein [Methylobacterium sp. 4-46]WFT83175.1 DUF6505 family protein [Methylobacterium nodulans]
MTRLKLPRTLRLDASDTLVFARAAEPGEWAVTGSFLFLDADPAALAPKARIAFRSGFLGIASFGFSTLVVVSEASEAEREAATEALAAQIHARLGAPSLAAAREAAAEEIAAAAALCQPPVNSVLALHRAVEAGEIREQYRVLRPREGAVPGADRRHAYARAFDFAETDDEPEEAVDLVGLMGSRAP